MRKKVVDLAKECDKSPKELINFLREKNVDVKSANSYVENEDIEKVYSFYGTPKSVLKARAEAAAAHKKIFYDADGNPIKLQRDENGKVIPYKGPMFDENGRKVVLKKTYYDENGNPIKQQRDENGKLIPYNGPIFDENGRKVILKKKNEKGEEKTEEKAPKAEAKSVETKPVEAEKTEKVEPAKVDAPAEAEKPAASAETKPAPAEEKAPEAPKKRENVYANRAADGTPKPVEKRFKDFRDDKDKKPAGKGDFKRGDKKPFDKNRDNNGEKKFDRNGDRPFNKNAQGDKSGFKKKDGFNAGFGKMDKGMFDKDKDSDTKRVFTKKTDNNRSGSAIKSELAKDISRDQRAAAFNDRKNKKKNNDRYAENEDGLKKPKNKKDPNRKGAFIKPVAPPKKEEDPNEIKLIKIAEVITIKELADKLKQNSSEIVKKLFMQGKMYSINSEIPYEEAEEIALEYEYLVEKEEVVNIVEELMKDIEDPEDSLVERPPVVCVMGHVDHGKTSILDAIRNTNVIAREAGGITQHIGAYMVEINGRKITFLDTPGHEAFTAMRLRGAMSTDIAVLVVAADDGVMPQTIEAINHAKAAGVQIVVAINKMDKEGANPDKVMSELSEHELISEEWGGSTIMVPVSAKKGEGINNLLEMILLTADVLELKANPNRKARGLVVEAKLDKGRGPVATVLVKKGTLKVGDNIAIGATHGKVRAMLNDLGENVKEATPSCPVEILGLNGVPNSGDELVVTETDKEARAIAEAFIAQGKEQLLAETKAKLSLDGLFDQIQAGNVKELNIIVKADVQGSVEAVKNSLVRLSNEEVAVRVIHSGAGNINESDVTLASASNAIIIGFNVKPDNAAKETAEKENVDLRLYSVIYNAIDDVEAAMNGLLDPIYEEKITGHAEIRQIFKASGIGNIAGSYVLDGKVIRGSKVRVYRKEELIHEGVLGSLKRFKDDAKEVAAGYECGLVFEKFNEFAEGDTVEFYNLEEVPRKREKKQY